MFGVEQNPSVRDVRFFLPNTVLGPLNTVPFSFVFQ